MSIDKFIRFFTSLKQGTSPGLPKAPHKPILLLALIQAIDDKIIAENRIYLSVELISYFRSYWDKLVSSGHTASFYLPFYHLSNEKAGFWKLQSKPGYEFLLTKSYSIRSFKALNDALEYAELDQELFSLLQLEQSRNMLKNVLLEKYFPDSVDLIRTYKSDYLKVLEDQIMHDSPVRYATKMKALLETTADKEEEVYVRGEVFKKQIPRIYHYTCAITGMKVEAAANINMIDACHIVPFAESYDDTITNGIALCPNMHRAFDRGLISIDNSYRVLISDLFIENYSSYNIHQFEKKEIALPHHSKYYPSQANLEKHRARFGFN